MTKFLIKISNKIREERTALLFLSKLLVFLCILKSGFFFYNYRISNGWAFKGLSNGWQVTKWSLIYDAICTSIIILPLMILVLFTGKLLVNKLLRLSLTAIFTVLTTFVVFLNTIDIFYFRFHLQRADADLLHVLKNPFNNLSPQVFLLIFAALGYCLIMGKFVYKNISAIINTPTSKTRFLFTNMLLILLISLFFLTGTKKTLPSFPLTTIEAVQLPLTQNSFHSFIYSLYRSESVAIPNMQYMSLRQQQALFSIQKMDKNSIEKPKNIVLFIMESVPAEFFDGSSPYKVEMPFLDSLVNKSTYFSNAFSYSYSSNKGITAILAGIPTMTDIPLYHSNYTAIAHSSVGQLLAKNNYQSAFFIGDNFDDFGFAKCCKWLGIESYYSMEDIPGNAQMEKHPMGLHDEYVLNFMQDKLAGERQPFLAIQYNISTHYPNDIPKWFDKKYANSHISKQQKSMQYYNDCLQKFFAKASRQPWFKNTVFLFCSDHWAQPDEKNIKIDEVESFRIPIIIYDPATEKKSVIKSTVSQLDILNTVLYYGGCRDSIFSYGENLADSLHDPNRTIFTKLNSTVYQAINKQYVLGFDALEGKPIYCYDYIKDPVKTANLLSHSPLSSEVKEMVFKMKAFLQTATNHYRYSNAKP